MSFYGAPKETQAKKKKKISCAHEKVSGPHEKVFRPQLTDNVVNLCLLVVTSVLLPNNI